MKLRVVLLLKKNKKQNLEVIRFLKKLNIFVIKVFFLKRGDNLNFLNKEKIDILISYLSPCIVPKKILNKTTTLNINFHPGPPLYPGLGCYNFALLNNDKKYGVTAHEMSEYVDTGRIFEVKNFSINRSENVKSLMEKSYKHLFLLFKNTMKEFKKKKELSYSKHKWLRKPYNRKEFEKIFESKNFKNRNEISNLIRSTYLEGYIGPIINLYGYKFVYLPDDKKK